MLQKLTALPKKELGLKQVKPELEHEAMCNPKSRLSFWQKMALSCTFLAACALARCYFQYKCEGPVTNLVVKDRLLAHNPLGAIYSRYWKRKLGIMDDGEV